MEGKVAVITGGTSGIGLALCRRLLAKDPTTRLVLLALFRAQGDWARQHLLDEFPGSDITVVVCDVSLSSSVFKAAKEITQSYKRVDLLYLNAGIMLGAKLDIEKFFKKVLSLDFVEMMTTGSCIIEAKESDTNEGLRKVFATNAWGHFLLVRELRNVFGRGSQIIWTGSSNADKGNFSLNDIQARSGTRPYSSSKYLVDILSYETNRTLQDKGVRSHVVCPGMVQSALTSTFMPLWMWYILIPLICLLRLLVPTLTRTPHHGAFVHEWLTTQDPADLDSGTRYLSACSVTGQEYVLRHKLDVDADTSRAAVYQLEILADRAKQLYC